MGIELETSSPRNSQSNGLAESGVKRCENIIVKSHLKTQSSIDEAVMCYNSKLRASGQGRPVDLFLKRRVRFLLPTVNKSGLATMELKAKRQRQLELIRLRTLKRMKHPQFQINDEVRIRDPKLGTWKQLGEIIDMKQHRDSKSWSYWVRNKETGSTLLKSAHELRISYRHIEDSLLGGIPEGQTGSGV